MFAYVFLSLIKGTVYNLTFCYESLNKNYQTLNW